MSIDDRTALAALCVTVAIASGSVVSLLSAKGGDSPVSSSNALIRTIPVQTSSIPAPRLRPAYTAANGFDFTEAHVSPDRFGFVPRHATDEIFTALAEGTLASEDFASWSAETKVATVPPSLVRLPQETTSRLPWLNEPAKRKSPYTLSERLREIGPSAQERLQTKFVSAKAPWRPTELALVAIKDEKVLELHARPAGGTWTFIHRYPVLAASGVNGPKLRRGDKQVPEGVYGISFLNANSRFHVALRVDYPNAFDRRMGQRDGRKDLGGDIMIHGKASSVGCLAIGDAAAEELFVLAAETGIKNIRLVIAPTDFRKNAPPAVDGSQPDWLPQLYTEVAAAMTPYKAPPSGSLLSLIFN